MLYYIVYSCWRYYSIPPRVSTGFSVVLFIFYVVSFAKAIKNVQVVALFSTLAFFCKVRKKVGGARTLSVIAARCHTPLLSLRDIFPRRGGNQPSQGGGLFVLTGRWQKAPPFGGAGIEQSEMTERVSRHLHKQRLHDTIKCGARLFLQNAPRSGKTIKHTVTHSCLSFILL